MDFGASFQPGQDKTQGGTRSGAQAAQEAVRVLSLRFPKVVGGSAPAPAPLLQTGGSGGNPFANSAVGMTQQRVPSANEPPVTTGNAQQPSVSGAPGGVSSPVEQALMALAGFSGGQMPAPSTPPPHITTGIDQGGGGVLPGAPAALPEQRPTLSQQLPPPTSPPSDWANSAPGFASPPPSPPPASGGGFLSELLKRKAEQDAMQSGNTFMG